MQHQIRNQMIVDIGYRWRQEVIMTKALTMKRVGQMANLIPRITPGHLAHMRVMMRKMDAYKALQTQPRLV